MSSIDERVVGMKFDNAQFEQGVKTTLASLDALNKSLKLEGATKGLSDVDAAAKNVQLGHIANAVDDIAGRFKAMSVIAITALANIATRAVDAGLSLIRSLTVDPINAGLEEYQTNINSIQTILSNTRWQNTGLNDVTKALDELNHYADLTIYNFTEMAHNIGTFTAAGVKLDVAVNAIKGIANLAAVSGSSSQQASVAMYQLSQAIATGTVKLIDWNSVVNAGLGGKVFQDALIETAKVHGIAVEAMIKQAGSFRGSLEKGWLTASVLTETLARFTGDLSLKQLESLGYSKEQALASVAMGKDAQEAATKVKTLTQLISTLREAAGSGWTQTWSIIFGNFNEAKELFTDVYTTLNAFVSANADARNKLLQDWKDLGGRTELIRAIQYAFNDVMEIIFPLKLAFRDVFPKTTAQELYNITIAIRDFFDQARHGEDTMTNLRRTFAGIFAVFDIGFQVIKQVVRVIFDLLGAATKGSGGFLEFTAGVGDFLVALDKAIKTGQGLTQFFDDLERILMIPIEALQYLGHLLSSLFSNIDTSQAADAVIKFASGVDPLTGMADVIVAAWGVVLSLFDDIFKTFEPLSDKLVKWFHEISEAVGGLNFESLLHAINTGAFAALITIVHNALGRSGVSGVLSTLTSSLQTMQHALRATILLEIAIAVGVLAAAVVVLSNIDSGALARSMTAMSVMFAQLIISLALVSKIPKTNVVQLYSTSGALVVLAVAINVLALAVKQLAAIDAKSLHKGLVGVMVLLGTIVTSANFLPNSGKFVAVGTGLLILSVAIKVLASAVQDLSGLNWEEIAKGLVAVGGILAALTLFTRFASTDATSVLSGAGIVLLAAGIKILASAIQDLSGISWENIGKGITVLAASLAAIGAALVIIPPTAPLQAAGIAIVATSLLILAQAMQTISGISWENVGKGMTVLAVSLGIMTAALVLLSDAAPTALLSAGAILIVALAVEVLSKALVTMGGMSWEQIAKGLIVLAASMTILVIALNAMTSGIAGAFALIIVSGALAVLAGVLVVLGKMSWGEIVKGLVTLAGVFLVLGLAGALLTPVIPTLLGLGIAIGLIGAGLALAGAGVFLFAAGLTALSVAGAAGAAAVVAILSAVIGLIPTLVQQVGVALLLLIDILIEGIPKIVDLIINLLIQLFDGLDRVLPSLGEAIIKLIDVVLKILEDAIPKMVVTGYHILIGILKGIRDNIREAIKTASQIVVNFLHGIADSIPGIIQAGVDLIFSFITGLTQAIDKNAERLGKAGGELAVAIIRGMVNGLKSGVGVIADAAKDVAKSALHAAMDFLGISSPSKEFAKVGEFSTEGMAIGVRSQIPMVENAAEAVGVSALDALKRTLRGFNDIIQGPIDLNPKITPVLDLTKVEREAGRLGAMLPAQPIDVNAAFVSSRNAFSDAQNNRDQSNQNGSSGDTTEVNYYQYNTSPKALTTAEIYRNTKNQLATAKGGLPK